MKIHLRPHFALIWMLGAFLLLTAQSYAQSTGLYGTRTVIEVPHTSETITLDGVADEAAWESAASVNPTANWDGAWSGHPEPDVFSTARTLHADGVLYVYVEVEDYDVFIDPENPGGSDQILLGVDLVHEPGASDEIEDPDFGGFVGNAPDMGPVTYKITHEAGITLNFDTDELPDPVAEGWVEGTTFFDETTLTWGVELAIVSDQVQSGSKIGFNVGLGHAKADGIDDRGEATYAFSSWEVCDTALVPEGVFCGAGGTVMHTSRSFASLALMPEGDAPYGIGLRKQIGEAEGTITLDGVADEAAWETATSVNPNANWDGAWSGHPEPDVFASSKMLYSAGALYVYVEVEDYDVFVDPENPGGSDQILLGVDLLYDPGNSDAIEDFDFGGFVANAPDLGPVTYKITSEAGITLNFNTEENPDPVAEGWVEGTAFFDESTLTWGVELAILGNQVQPDALVGFNVGLGHAKSEGIDDRGEATYAFSSWEVCDADTVPEGVFCGAGGTVMHTSRSFASLELVSSEPVDIERLADAEIPSGYALSQNYPNPFNPSTTLEYQLTDAGAVEIAVFNTLGQRVATLVNEQHAPGTYRVSFDAATLPSGLYLSRMSVDGQVVQSRTMTLIK